jgi:hypothetical protein
MKRRVLIVYDGTAWFARRVQTIIHNVDNENDIDEKVYRCDKHLGGPFESPTEALRAIDPQAKATGTQLAALQLAVDALKDIAAGRPELDDWGDHDPTRIAKAALRRLKKKHRPLATSVGLRRTSHVANGRSRVKP